MCLRVYWQISVWNKKCGAEKEYWFVDLCCTTPPFVVVCLTHGICVLRKSTTPQAPDKAEPERKARALPGDRDRYRMDYPSIGTCVIINNKNFLKSTGKAPRYTSWLLTHTQTTPGLWRTSWGVRSQPYCRPLVRSWINVSQVSGPIIINRMHFILQSSDD